MIMGILSKIIILGGVFVLAYGIFSMVGI